MWRVTRLKEEDIWGEFTPDILPVGTKIQVRPPESLGIAERVNNYSCITGFRVLQMDQYHKMFEAYEQAQNEYAKGIATVQAKHADTFRSLENAQKHFEKVQKDEIDAIPKPTLDSFLPD